jgi:hypothetical protein
MACEADAYTDERIHPHSYSFIELHRRARSALNCNKRHVKFLELEAELWHWEAMEVTNGKEFLVIIAHH